MPELVVASAAAIDLANLIRSHSLPEDSAARFRRSVEPLRRFPLFGAALAGRYEGARFVLGPWRWMVIVYVFDPDLDRVTIVAVVDGRSAGSIR